VCDRRRARRPGDRAAIDPSNTAASATIECFGFTAPPDFFIVVSAAIGTEETEEAD